VQLDHLTRGRAMFGAGPGALPSDAYQMGIEVGELRRMMEEGLEAIVALLEGEEPVTRKTDWFELREARLHLRPFTHPIPDLRVAAIVSPSGPRAAGRFGLGLLSMGATGHDGFNALQDAWSIVEERAAEYGRTSDRQRWSLVGPMHIATTEAQAREDVKHGLLDWYEYFLTASPHPLPQVDTVEEAADAIVASRMAVIGTPQQAIAQIERLVEQSGGFGTYLVMINEWADFQATCRSLELIARYVMPRFQGQLEVPRASFRWLASRSGEFRNQFTSAQQKATADHRAEQERTAAPATPTVTQ
jgi:limonene 1,2-monooxygenase